MKQEPFESGMYFHVFNRGNNKENLFKDEDNYQYFLKLIKKYLFETCTIYSFCLLPNHFHILLRIKDIDNLPEIYQIGKKKLHQPFSNLFNAYSKAINKKYNRTGSLFQEHLHRIRINSEEYFRELVLYIHLNPEKHGVFNDFSKYRYSSYKSYFSEKSNLLNTNEVIECFGDKENLIYCHQQRKIKIDLLKEIEKIDNI